MRSPRPLISFAGLSVQRVSNAGMKRCQSLEMSCSASCELLRMTSLAVSFTGSGLPWRSNRKRATSAVFAHSVASALKPDNEKKRQWRPSTAPIPASCWTAGRPIGFISALTCATAEPERTSTPPSAPADVSNESGYPLSTIHSRAARSASSGLRISTKSSLRRCISSVFYRGCRAKVERESTRYQSAFVRDPQCDPPDWSSGQTSSPSSTNRAKRTQTNSTRSAGRSELSPSTARRTPAAAGAVNRVLR